MLFWFYAYRSVLARMRTNAISMLAVCVFVVGGTLGLSYYASLKRILMSVPTENIIVVAKSATFEMDSKLTLDAARKVALFDGIKKQGDVPLVAREVVSRVFVSESFGRFEPPRPIRGIDELSLAIHGVKIEQGKAPPPNSLELLVGKRLAERHPHLVLGYEMDMPGGKAKIGAIFSADGGAFEDEVWTLRPALELHINQKTTSSVTLVAESPQRVGEIIDKINASKDLQARAVTVAEYRAEGAGLATIVRTVLMLLVLMSVVAIFAIATTMSSAVAIRIPELAALAAIGIRRSVLGRIILLESALLGLTGALIGVGVSAIVITQLGTIPLGTSPVQIELAPPALLIGLGLGTLAGIVGGIVPALQVRRVDILVAMR